MSNPPPQQPPSNGGEFLLSLIQNSQTPPQQQLQSQSPQQPGQHSLTMDPAVAAVGPALLFPSQPMSLLHHPQQQVWHDLNPMLRQPQGFSALGGYFGNQFAGVNFGFGVLGDGGVVHHQQQLQEQKDQGEQRLMFGSIPSGITRFGGFNGLDTDRLFADPAILNYKSSTSGYWGLEPGRRLGNELGNQYQSLNMRTSPPGFQREPVGLGHWDSGDNRGLGRNVDKEKERGNGLSYGKSLAKEHEGVRMMWSEDGKKVGELGPSGQLDRPGPPAGSNLKSYLSSDMEDALMKLHTEVGGDGKNHRREEVHDDIDDLGEEMVDSLLLEDESNSKNNRKQHHKELRSDLRGQQMLSQRGRILKRQMQCRRDIERLNIPFIEIYKSLIPPEEEKAKQKLLLMSLERIILKEWPRARLYIYGSCASSFGVSKSDVDVCLAFGNMDINKSEVLLKLAEKLESNNMQNVQALTRARVPIVKLMDSVTGLSCDICINNVLAVVNTKLLRDYAQIDVRLHQLAFIVKHWAKCRRVNETYQGTLSSYAYVLMCIHFLQQRKPAILPCLQSMETTYSVTVDDIHCAYFDQVEKLRSFGSHNKESVAQLVWSFFNYWAFCHDYSNSVISIRTGSIICKREKDWTRRVGNDRHLICIEDPFETSHDLGRVVDRRSVKVLREEFERAADIMQYDPHPFVSLFEPYVPK